MNEPTALLSESTLSVNALAQPLLQRLLSQADALGVAATRDAAGVTVVDAGI